MTGRVGKPHSEETKRQIRQSNQEFWASEEGQEVSEARSGENHYHWKGGYSDRCGYG